MSGWGKTLTSCNIYAAWIFEGRHKWTTVCLLARHVLKVWPIPICVARSGGCRRGRCGHLFNPTGIEDPWLHRLSRWIVCHRHHRTLAHRLGASSSCTNSRSLLAVCDFLQPCQEGALQCVGRSKPLPVFVFVVQVLWREWCRTERNVPVSDRWRMYYMYVHVRHYSITHYSLFPRAFRTSVHRLNKTTYHWIVQYSHHSFQPVHQREYQPSSAQEIAASRAYVLREPPCEFHKVVAPRMWLPPELIGGQKFMNALQALSLILVFTGFEQGELGSAERVCR